MRSELMTYGEDTAGGIMTTEFVAVPARSPPPRRSTACASWSPTPRRSTTSTSPTRTTRLVGVLSLRDLIVAKPDTCIDTFMYPEPVALRTDASQEEVTEVVARYNLLAVPVVDAEGRLEGIVTVDDAIDTLLPQLLSAACRGSSAGPGPRSDEGTEPHSEPRAVTGSVSPRSSEYSARASSAASPTTTPAASPRTPWPA